MKNISAQLQLELSVLREETNMSITMFAFNQTVTLLGNTTQLYLTNANGNNGTLYFLFANGCETTGSEGHIERSGQNYTVFLRNYGTMSSSIPLDSTPFTVSFHNGDTAGMACTFYLIYVYKNVTNAIP